MKCINLFLFLALSMILFTTCKKNLPEEEVSPYTVYWGEASAIVNGETHICKSAATMLNSTRTINLSINFDVIPDYLRHRVEVSHLPPATGLYQLQDFIPLVEDQPAFVNFGWYSGDAIVSFYHQLIDSTFLLNVTQLDTITNNISGTYSGIFVTESPEPGNPAPDTVRIEQGMFKTKIGRQ